MRAPFSVLAAGLFVSLAVAPALTQSRVAQPRPSASADWPVFGGDVAHTNASPAPSPINASNAASLVRHQFNVDGIIDASVIYLKGVTVGGAAHDTLFGTTRFGETVA